MGIKNRKFTVVQWSLLVLVATIPLINLGLLFRIYTSSYTRSFKKGMLLYGTVINLVGYILLVYYTQG
jgi:hypothetical protein